MAFTNFSSPRRAERSGMGIDMEKELEIIFLNSKNTEVEKTGGGFLNIKTGGVKYENVQLVRTFPFSGEDQYISVRTADEEAREIGMIEDLARDFQGNARAYMQEQLEIRYFTPVIKKINSIREEGGSSYFDVETDAGRSRFVIRTNENAFIKLSETRVIIEDLEGNRYEIPDLNKLTARERKKLDIFL